MKHDTSTGVGWEEVCFLELVLLCLPFVGLLLVGRSVANMLTGGLDRGHRLFLCLPSSKLLAQRPWRWLHQVRPHTCISASSGAANILTASVHTIVSPTLQLCVLLAFTQKHCFVFPLLFTFPFITLLHILCFFLLLYFLYGIYCYTDHLLGIRIHINNQTIKIKLISKKKQRLNAIEPSPPYCRISLILGFLYLLIFTILIIFIRNIVVFPLLLWFACSFLCEPVDQHIRRLRASNCWLRCKVMD